ncbi:MAG: hypothetical protein IJ524_02020 [Bacteroidales bacterium]|nr:hypothetical protein [Bacteroidales bacterium]
MKRLTVIAVLILFLASMQANAQTTDDQQKMDYTRGSGFVIRPELNNGLLATLGYQINPYVMLEGSLGFDLSGSAAMTTVIGVRAYTSSKPWAAFFDYRVGAESVSGYSITRHTIVAGAAYKDFDFGAGVIFGTDGTTSVTGLSISIGYNIRCYKHR